MNEVSAGSRSRVAHLCALIATFFSSQATLAAPVQIDFTNRSDLMTPSFSESGVTITGSSDVSINSSGSFDGLGIAGGTPGFGDEFIDNFAVPEFIDFTFDNGPVNRIGFELGSSFFGTGTTTIEAFGPGNISLGTITQDWQSGVQSVSAFFDDQPIERFRVVPETNQGIFITGLQYDPVPVPAPSSLRFNINNLGGFEPGTGPRMALDAATDYLSSIYRDPIEVNLDIGVDSLPGFSTLGTASTTSRTFEYEDYRNSVINDATSPDDHVTAANLPVGSFNMLLSETLNNPNGSGSTVAYVDDNTDDNNTNLLITTANAKAVGLIPGTAVGSDGEVLISQDRVDDGLFDYDQSDGIDPLLTDATALLIHEIGHIMGFTLTAGGFGRDDDRLRARPLNLHRFSEESAAEDAIDFRDIEMGDFYFSFDGGVTNVTGGAAWNNQGGPGSRFAHWRQGADLGLMGPLLPRGELLLFSELDIQAFDIIGWTLVPEPTGGALVLLAAVAGASVRPRRGQPVRG